MSRRPPALAVSLMLAAVAVLVPAAPALAQTCLPPSAEEAFEELLDLATDDSPVEDEAWKIADEQEARGAFETPETIQKIDGLAQANGFVFDCAQRLYLPVSGPDPRVAIENGEEPAEPDGEQPDEDDGSAPRSIAPPRGGKAPAPGQVPGQAGAAPVGTATHGVPGSPAGPDANTQTATAGRTGGATAGDRLTSGQGDEGAGADVAAPGDAPDGQGEVVLLPENSGSPAGRTAAVTLLFLAMAIATVVTAARAKRDR